MPSVEPHACCQIFGVDQGDMIWRAIQHIQINCPHMMQQTTRRQAIGFAKWAECWRVESQLHDRCPDKPPQVLPASEFGFYGRLNRPRRGPDGGCMCEISMVRQHKCRLWLELVVAAVGIEYFRFHGAERRFIDRRPDAVAEKN